MDSYFFLRTSTRGGQIPRQFWQRLQFPGHSTAPECPTTSAVCCSLAANSGSTEMSPKQKSFDQIIFINLCSLKPWNCQRPAWCSLSQPECRGNVLVWWCFFCFLGWGGFLCAPLQRYLLSFHGQLQHMRAFFLKIMDFWINLQGNYKNMTHYKK